MRSPPGSTPISTDYVLTLADGGYRFDGKVLPFKVEHKSYKVRQPDGSLKTVSFDQRIAAQGPVFDLADGRTIALKVAGLDRPGVLQQYFDMGRAHDRAA
jgi:acyl-homoserine-lactone acylase